MGKKFFSLLAVFVLLLGLLAGCGKKESKQSSAPADKTPAAQTTGTNQSITVKSGSGIYNGEIDSNSVEIKFNGEDKAFRLSDSVKKLFEGDTIKAGDRVSFSYIEDQYGRLVITGVDKTP